MTCEQFLALYSDYLDEHLDSVVAARVRNHLLSCPSCARYDRVLREGLGQLRDLPEVDPSSDFLPRLQHRLYHEDNQRAALRHQGSGSTAAVSVGIAAVLAAIAWSPLFRSAGPPALETVAESVPVLAADEELHGGEAVGTGRYPALTAERLSDARDRGRRSGWIRRVEPAGGGPFFESGELDAFTSRAPAAAGSPEWLAWESPQPARTLAAGGGLVRAHGGGSSWLLAGRPGPVPWPSDPGEPLWTGADVVRRIEDLLRTHWSAPGGPPSLPRPAQGYAWRAVAPGPHSRLIVSSPAFRKEDSSPERWGLTAGRTQ